MADRPVFHPSFGKYLEGLREAKTLANGRKWTQSDAERFAAEKQLPLTRQILLHLEDGKTKNPEPDVLRAVAKLYDVPYAEVAGQFIASRFSLELSDVASLVGGVTHPVTGAVLQQPPQPSSSERPRAETVTVHPSILKTATQIREYAKRLGQDAEAFGSRAATLSALANSLVQRTARLRPTARARKAAGSRSGPGTVPQGTTTGRGGKR